MRTKAILLLTTLIVACSDQSGTSVQTARVLKQPLTASGEIVSLNTASISPPSVRGMWQMKVQFLVPENAHVKEGDMLVKFDDQQLKTKLIEQRSELEAESKNYQTKQLEDEAKLEELKLALAEAQMNYDKQKRLVEIVDVATKRVEKEKQRKEFEIAQSKLAQAQQQLEQFTTSRSLNDELARSKINRLRTKLSRTQSNIDKSSTL